MTEATTTGGNGDQAGLTGPPALDQHLCFALYSASGLMTRLYRPLLEPLGLTYPQYLAMLALWEKAPRTVGDLGGALGLDSATLTPLLKRLEQSGFISRRRDPKDERRVLVRPTAEGTALRDRAGTVPRDLFCQLPLDAGEFDTLLHAVRSLAKKLREVDDRGSEKA